MATQEPKMYPFEEIANHNQKNDCWLIMFGKVFLISKLDVGQSRLHVYDVTSFLDDHPGGDEIMVSSTGKDATNDFEDVGHSKTARNMLDKYYIGDVDPLTFKVTHATVLARKASTDDNSKSFMMKILQLLVPIVILGLAIVVRSYTKVEQ